MFSRKYQFIIGAVFLTIVAVGIWAMLPGKEKTAASALADQPVDTTGLKQPDTDTKTNAIQPQGSGASQKTVAAQGTDTRPNAVQPQSSGASQKTIVAPTKQPTEPITETKNASSSSCSRSGIRRCQFRWQNLPCIPLR